jgi:hypothetical protein
LLRGAAGIGLGSTANYLRRTTSGTAGSGLDTTIKYLVNQTRARVTIGPVPTAQKLSKNYA